MRDDCECQKGARTFESNTYLSLRTEIRLSSSYNKSFGMSRLWNTPQVLGFLQDKAMTDKKANL